MSGRWWVVAAAVVLAAGCASSDPMRQFALPYAGGNPAPAYTPLAENLGVATFGANAFYNRQRIAWRAGEEHDYHQTLTWEGIPRELLAEAVVDAARAQGAFTQVRHHPAAWGTPPAVVVRGRLEAFDDIRTAAGREAYVAANVALTDATGRTVYWEGPLEARRPISDDSAGALVAAFRACQSAVADAIVAQARRVAIENAAATQAAAAAD